MNTNASSTTQKAPATHVPIDTLRLGRIRAAIWETEADKGKFYNVTFSRSYLGKDQKWHNTDSFSRDDLPVIAKLASDAHDLISSRMAAAKTQPQVA